MEHADHSSVKTGMNGSVDKSGNWEPIGSGFVIIRKHFSRVLWTCNGYLRTVGYGAERNHKLV